MKKMYIEIVIDESSSMKSSQNDTIDGLNKYMAEQADTSGVEIFVSVTKFNTTAQRVAVSVPVKDLPKFSAIDSPEVIHYAPNGNTALFDAVAAAIHDRETSCARDPDADVLFLIYTDGEENSSQEFSRSSGGLEKLKAIIQSKQDSKWTFVFFGTDINAWDAGCSIGISGHNTMKVDRQNTSQMYSAVSESTRLRAACLAKGSKPADNFFAGNLADYADLATPAEISSPIDMNTWTTGGDV